MRKDEVQPKTKSYTTRPSYKLEKAGSSINHSIRSAQTPKSLLLLASGSKPNDDNAGNYYIEKQAFFTVKLR